jgi:bifunctional enzyme CysN/CysC
MCKADESPAQAGTRFRANIFWMGRAPLVPGRKYKLKLAASHASVRLVKTIRIVDAVDLSLETHQEQVDRHDVAEVILETMKPVAFDLTGNIDSTSRFAIVDNYEISGAGIILENILSPDSMLRERTAVREIRWEGGAVTPHERETRFGHKPKFILFVGGASLQNLARDLEKSLFRSGHQAYFLGMESLESGLDADIPETVEPKEERIRRLGELARILTGAGLIFITVLPEADEYDLKILKTLNAPNEIMICGAIPLETILVELRNEKIIPEYQI